MGGVLAELFGEDSFGSVSAGEDEKATGVAVDAMNGANRGWSASTTAAAFDVADDVRQLFVEGGLNLLAAFGPVLFLAVPIGGHAGGLFDDDNVRIEILDADVAGAGRSDGGMREQLNDILWLQAATGIDAQISVEHDVARFNEFADSRPGVIGEPTAQRGAKSLIFKLRRGVK